MGLLEPVTSGVHCLTAIARHYGIALQTGRRSVGGGTPSALVRLAKRNGLRARAARITLDELRNAAEAFPFLLRRKDGTWLIASGYQRRLQEDDLVVVIDPSSGSEFQFLKPMEFSRIWDGDVVLVKRKFAPDDPDRPFNIRWFVDEMWRQRGLLRDVVIAAIILYLLGVAVPIYFQIVVDKVLVHQSYATLYVLTIGVVAATLFEALFSFLRRYLILHLSNTIDIRVATHTVTHLMRLPIDFFEHSRAGVVVKHMQQGEKIREFLAGRLFLTLVDSTALVVFVPVLLLYSARLTAIVLVFGVLVSSTIGLLIGPFKSRLKYLYEVEGRRQSLLVEAIHGMATVKSLAIERQQTAQWTEMSAAAIGGRYRVGLISATAQTVTSGLEKLLLVTIIAVGTQLVFDDAITVGTLIAFQMLSGRVSGPLAQLVGLVHEYQDAALSVRMLGTIMNARPEWSGFGGMTPPVKGAIEFSDVVFRYDQTKDPAIDGLSFTVPAGTIFGIVGHSGSGKTTVTRLIRGLYQLQSGAVRIDGHELRNIDLGYLRTQIGVVLQENFLFRGTVRDNIAIARPDTPLESIIAAAQAAGAMEFIDRLPNGLNTVLEENGSNLSGGQRQRLAIARALLTHPPILVFDEATSALDPDSEAAVRDNLRQIARGRTLIIVSHRLSTLADAANILVLERGRRVGFGDHDKLMRECEIYKNLWRQQSKEPEPPQ